MMIKCCLPLLLCHTNVTYIYIEERREIGLDAMDEW